MGSIKKREKLYMCILGVDLGFDVRGVLVVGRGFGVLEIF